MLWRQIMAHLIFIQEVNRQALNAIQRVILGISNRDIAKALEARLRPIVDEGACRSISRCFKWCVCGSDGRTLKRQSQIAAFIEDEHQPVRAF